jgi:U3 small nucleolar RNA-associated protein 7
MEKVTTLDLNALSVEPKAKVQRTKQLELPKRLQRRIKSHERQHRQGSSVAYSSIKNKKLKQHVSDLEKDIEQVIQTNAIVQVFQSDPDNGGRGLLETQGMEKSWKFPQHQLGKLVDAQTRERMFSLQLPELGPYNVDFTRNASHLLFGGRKGHIALMNWKKFDLLCELQVKETIRDVK